MRLNEVTKEIEEAWPQGVNAEDLEVEVMALGTVFSIEGTTLRWDVDEQRDVITIFSSKGEGSPPYSIREIFSVIGPEDDDAEINLYMLFSKLEQNRARDRKDAEEGEKEEVEKPQVRKRVRK
jgi:hypothetical protein